MLFHNSIHRVNHLLKCKVRYFVTSFHSSVETSFHLRCSSCLSFEFIRNSQEDSGNQGSEEHLSETVENI